MNELLHILEEMKPDVDFNNTTGLIDNAIFDSFDIVQIVQELNEKFDIEIPLTDIIPENFNSAELIWKMIEKLRK